MADAAQNASPAPAVGTESTGDNPKVESKKIPEGTTPASSAIAQEPKPVVLDTPPTKASSPSPAAGPTPSVASVATAPPIPENAAAPASTATAAETPAQKPSTPPAPVKKETTSQSPESSSLAQTLSISIPTATNGTTHPTVAATGTAAAAASSSSSASAAPASAVPASIAVPHVSVPTPAISPLSDVPPAKRSRTPEDRVDSREEKRQKTEHVADKPRNQQGESAKQTDDATTGANKDTGVDTVEDDEEPDLDADGLLGWDLEAQLSNVLDSIDMDVAKDSNDEDDEDKMDTSPTPILPPPKKRLEKMKFIENPTYFSRAMGLPMLGSLSVQILLALFQQPSEVTDRQIRDVRTEGGKVYSALRSTFMAVLKLFTDATVFLSADDLDIHEPGDRETIQMANLASMCASFYGPGGPTMATAHDNFLKIMIPENGIITEDISDLYLDQKTQSFLAYANVMEDKESTRNSLMDKFFPLDLEDKLKAYWKDSSLSMSAEEFVKPYTERRNLLKAIGHDKEKRKALEAKYQFASFLDNLSAFIRSNFDSILDYAESHGFEVPNEAGEEDLMLQEAKSTYAGSFPGQPRRPNGADGSYDTLGLASLITEKLNGLDGYSYVYGSSGIPESTTLPPGQSLPTSVLYERARQAAVAKPTVQSRREGLHSTRRPWSPEEEKALMAGLDLVKGPHWSQILQLFGMNGTLSDILKDRTQVQLKDKARNLKLFFLKTNSEMPYYLQCVTGELKTRAPSQAARKEAEEQARVQAGGSPGTYASTYMNGSNGTGSLNQAIAGSPRPGSTTPSGGPSTPVAGHAPHHQGQQHQGYHQQTYQQQRPAAIQPAPNGASHTPAITSYAAANRPLQPQPAHHQPIAPAPSYQRPLQQAGTPAAAQYQQRPLQQPAIQTPATYQQAQQQAQRAMANSSAASAQARPLAHQSTVSQQTQARPAAGAAGTQPASATHRPPAAGIGAQPRATHMPPQTTSNPTSTTTSIPKGVPVNSHPGQHMTPTSLPAKPIQQTATQQPSMTAAQAGAARPINSTQNRPAAPPAAKALPVPAPAAAPAAMPAAKPPAPAPNPVPTPAQTAESKRRAEEDLLAKTLKAAIDSS